MKRITILLPICFLMFQGCAQQQVKPVTVDKVDPVDQKITEISIDIQRNLRRLADTNNAVAVEKFTPEEQRYISSQALTIPPGMDKRVSINWDGPIEPFLQTMANQTGYRFIEKGVRPVPTIMIRIMADNKRVIDLVRDAGLQAGEKGLVRVIESGQVLELQYADR